MLKMDNEDARILELFNKNEREAFRELFIRYYKPMVLAAKLYSNNAHESEDIVQQVFVKVWEEKLYCRINSSFKNYLQVSVRNACFNQIASLKIKPAIERDINEDMLTEQAIDFMLLDEEIIVFKKAFDALPMQSRAVFEMIYFEDQPYKAAAQSLKLSVNTIKSHLRNALRILKNSPVINNYYSDRKKS
jgi:RNA polymerase sigma-70 factor (family 1)